MPPAQLPLHCVLYHKRYSNLHDCACTYMHPVGSHNKEEKESKSYGKNKETDSNPGEIKSASAALCFTSSTPVWL